MTRPHKGGEEFPTRLTREEARELARRLERTRRHGGASLEDIRADMLRDMVKELREMVRSYSGRPRETRELLKCLVIAQTEGVTTEQLSDVLGALLGKLERKAA